MHILSIAAILAGCAPGASVGGPRASGARLLTEAFKSGSDQANANLGYAVASAGDVNGDGYADLIGGAYHYSGAYGNGGLASLWLGSAAGVITPAAWSVDGDRTNAYLGGAVASAGDVNGDGYDDVVVGAYGYEDGEYYEGHAELYLGSASGLGTVPAWSVDGESDYAFLGDAVASAGDVDGDGYDDVLVGALAYTGDEEAEGRVDLYRGSTTGLSATPAWTFDGVGEQAAFGAALSSADVNGDGYDDVIVGAEDAHDDDYYEGFAYLFLGSAAGLSPTPAWSAGGDHEYARFGAAVAGAGDVDGDGYEDVLIGAPSWDGQDTAEGRAYLFRGTAGGLGPEAAWTAEGDQIFAEFASALAGAGDLNGDGYDDVVIGAWRSDEGELDEGLVYAWLGSPTGLPTAPAWVAGSDQANASFGYAVGGGGDVDADGYADVVIGARNYDDPESSEGLVFVFRGGCDGDEDAICDLGELCTGDDATGDSDADTVCDDRDTCLTGDDRDDPDRDALPSACDGCLGDNATGDDDADGVCDDLDRCDGDDGSGDADGDRTCDDLDPCFGDDASGDIDGDGVCDVFVGWSDRGTFDEDYGYSVASAGDVNGDGHDDVIVGAPRWSITTPGAYAAVHLGSPDGTDAVAAWRVASAGDNDAFGASVASAGDVNGDGYDDVLVGAPHHSGGLSQEGAAHLYLGSAAGLAATPAWSVESDQFAAGLGTSVASAGDVNGDGYDDVLVGTPDWDGGQTDEGRATLYLGSAAGLSATAAWTVEADQGTAHLGAAVASAGDVNGDGYDDVLVGAPLFDGASVDEGRVWLYLGSAAGPAPTPAVILELGQQFAELGTALAPAGDVDGDGLDDVLVGAPFYDDGETDEGAVFLYLGRPTGLAGPSWTVGSNQAATVCWGCSNRHPDFGRSVAATDWNGDGFVDVVVGASYHDAGADLMRNDGAAFVYPGSSAGLATTPSRVVTRGTDAAAFGYSVASAGDVDADGFLDLIVGAPASAGVEGLGRAFVFPGGCDARCDLVLVGAGGDFGWAVGWAGDVDGDGSEDLLVGAPRFAAGQAREGRISLFAGSAVGLGTTATWTADGEQVGAALGYAVSAGDLNGDGFADAAAGAIGYEGGEADEGQVLVWLGGTAGLGAVAWTAESDQAGARLGFSLACGDVDGDGFDDLLAGASRHDAGQADEGAVFAWLGSPAGPDVVPAWTGEADRSGARLGWSLSAGDVDADGYDDVLAGSPAWSDPEADEGRAWLFLGDFAGPPAAAAWTFDADQAGAQLGGAVAFAGDVDGDGFGDLVVGAPGFDGGQTDEGRAWLFLGDATGPGAAPAWTVEPDQASALLGRAVAAAGDRDGDGLDDVIVGAPKYDGGHWNGGRADLFLGANAPAGPAWALEGDLPGALLGRSLAGNARADLAVGAHAAEAGQGRVYVFPAPDLRGARGPVCHTRTRHGGGDVPPHPETCDRHTMEARFSLSGFPPERLNDRKR